MIFTVYQSICILNTSSVMESIYIFFFFFFFILFYFFFFFFIFFSLSPGSLYCLENVSFYKGYINIVLKLVVLDS